MALTKHSLQVGRAHRGTRLDQFLAEALPAQAGVELSRRGIRRLIAAGAVYLDGKRIRVQSRAVTSGARVELYLERGASAPPPAAGDAEEGLAVLFEDADLIAVDKPSGVAAQATVDDDVGHLFALVRRFLRRRDGGEAYVALHHRLDRGTSGVQLLSKSHRANAGLTEAFRERAVGKLYLALAAPADGVSGVPETSWTVRDHLELTRTAPEGPRRAVSVVSGGRPAETELSLRELLAGAALIEAVPKTGRTHQIRVHLADSGWPVVGDRLYGPPQPALRAPRLMLHAARLELAHPVSGAPLRIESPLPADFAALLATLRR